MSVMSLLRTVYLGAVICGWMAFGGWFAAEILAPGCRPARGIRDGGPNDAAADDHPLPRLADAGRGACEREEPGDRGVLPGGCRDRRGSGAGGGLSNWRLGPQVFRMMRGLIAGGLGGFAGAGWVP